MKLENGKRYLTIGGNLATFVYQGVCADGSLKYLFVHHYRNRDLSYDTSFWHREDGRVHRNMNSPLDIACEA